MKPRTNTEWLQALRATGKEQTLALADLRTYLLRAALFSLRRNSGHLDPDEIAQLAEDAAQDALVAILDHLDDFRSESKFTTWVYKFAINFAMVAARREIWKHVSLDELLDQEGAAVLLENDSPAPAPNVSALRNEVWTCLQDIMVNSLTERQRQALKAVVLDDVPLDEVAYYWGSNRNATYKLLHDARRKVKSEMEARGFSWTEIAELFASPG